jgi:hypothetical protein
MNYLLILKRAIIVIIVLIIFIEVGIIIQENALKCINLSDNTPKYNAKCSLQSIIGGYLTSSYIIITDLLTSPSILRNQSIQTTFYQIFFTIIEIIIAICISFLVFRRK